MCEVPVDGDAGQRYFICPTGYAERPVPVSEDEVSSYRFDFPAFRTEFATDNGLTPCSDDLDLGQAFHPVAMGRMGGKSALAIYTANLNEKEAPTVLPALKGRLQCDSLIVLTPRSKSLDKTLADTLSVEDIAFVTLDELFARRTFELDLADYCHLRNDLGNVSFPDEVERRADEWERLEVADAKSGLSDAERPFFGKEGNTWRVEFGGISTPGLADRDGMLYIARLLQTPNLPVDVLDLWVLAHPGDS
ncbi:MAG TPA: hypothetical protein VMY42_08225, partial [Thermoguttaceae bacterium]|nr:hypothetical protein [Thermoguttaceae bacterium]